MSSTPSTVIPDTHILRALLISFRGGKLLVPNSAVVQALPFATPLKIEHAPNWILGAMLWRARTIPLVSFGHLLNPKLSPHEQHARIVVLNTLNQKPKLPNFGLLSTEAPQSLNLSRMSVIDAGPQTSVNVPGVARWVKVNGEDAIIPDLDALENILISLMRA